MPIYEYQCKLCGHQLEAFQKITDKPLILCPNCHKSSLDKLISSTSFQLKGTGWYVTDFRDKNKPKEQSKKEDNAQSNTTSADNTSVKKEEKSTEKKESNNSSSSKSE